MRAPGTAVSYMLCLAHGCQAGFFYRDCETQVFGRKELQYQLFRKTIGPCDEDGIDWGRATPTFADTCAFTHRVVRSILAANKNHKIKTASFKFKTGVFNAEPFPRWAS